MPTWSACSLFSAGGQRRRMIIITLCGGQAGRSDGVLARNQPRTLEPEPQRLPVDRRHDLEGDQREGEAGAQQLRRVEGASAPVKGRGEQGAVAVGFEDAQLDLP